MSLPGFELDGLTMSEQEVAVEDVDGRCQAQVCLAEQEAVIAGIREHHKITNDPEG